MIYAKKTITMSDGNENVFHSWVPEQEVKAAVVLSHGMTEFAFRYNDLADFFCKNGIAVYAEDHRGHGETAALAEKNKTGMFGYLADKDGFFRVADDVFEEIQAVKNLYPGKKVFLLGHSFGSLVSQCIIEKYGEQFDGCILCATAGPRNVTVFFAKILASVFSRLYGRKKVSKFIDKTMKLLLTGLVMTKKMQKNTLTIHGAAICVQQDFSLICLTDLLLSIKQEI